MPRTAARTSRHHFRSTARRSVCGCEQCGEGLAVLNKVALARHHVMIEATFSPQKRGDYRYS